jgi:subtilisin family serine protease
MHHRVATTLLALASVASVTACKDQAPIPHTPTHLSIVSGANQSGDVSAPLAKPLVVQALDGANRAVAGVPLTWSAVGGGTLSATSSTTDNSGQASVTWTLSPTAGVQVVTVTSTKINNASVSFVANNGAMISGTVTSAVTGPYFGANLSRTPTRAARLSAARTITRQPSIDHIVVGFKSSALGVAAAGSGAYRTLSVARATSSAIRDRVASVARQLHLSHAQISPAILAARLRVDDATQIDAVMAALRSDPNVAWVERDQIVTIRDGAPKPMSTDFVPAAQGLPAGGPIRTASALVPNDPGYFEQTWPANMIDLPRAWTLTTGSPTVIVASVDMGIRFDSPDIAANLTNDGYDFVSQIGFSDPQQLCDGSPFTTIDGDGDGPDADPTDPDDLEFNFFLNCWDHAFLGDHGLWTAGIIASAANDAVGGAGVAWNVKIRPIRVLGITGQGTDFDIAQGVLYAAGLPAAGADSTTPVIAPSRAQIINMSLGGPSPDSTLGAAVAAAIDAGTLVVASAGNDGLDFPEFPAAYPGVMAVGAVGMDGMLATYSNAGTFISVTAPGGDFRLDDNGGGGVYGPGWDFVNGRSVHLFGYGTSASAPYVSGVAALLLSKEPNLTPAQLRSRIEQYASRTPGLGRSDTYGWGIVNAYNALTQGAGQRKTLVRLVDATTGLAVKTATVATNGNFALTQLQTGAYYLQAGDDEGGDGQIGVPGRRFAWAGGAGKPTVFNVNGNAQTVAIPLGVPTEVEPNDDAAHANFLSVGSYVIGVITPPDTRDVYSVTIATPGTYTFETSGVVGSCGLGVELDTFIQVASASGTSVGSNDNFVSPTGRFCSRVQASLTTGVYYVTVGYNPASPLATNGRYRLEVRAGT